MNHFKRAHLWRNCGNVYRVGNYLQVSVHAEYCESAWMYLRVYSVCVVLCR
jgi:hypothetical protein